jgi:hypothetical protein
MPFLLLVALARRRLLPRAFVPLLLLAILSISACVILTGKAEVAPVDLASPVTLTSPVKAHLRDGTTVLYRRGVTVAAESLEGPGVRYSLTLADSAPVTAMAIADVAGMESFRRVNEPMSSTALSLLGTAALGALGAAVAVAIFGSCPTVYSDSAGHQLLEAEGFSYSIAPLFEARDVDRLKALPDARGQVRLEVRNEAAETHFLNQLELLDVEHLPGETVVPDPEGRPVAAQRVAALAPVLDRAGRDVSPLLAAADGTLFASDTGRVRSATAGDLYDDLTFTLPAMPADSALVVLRLRNSLLTTVLFYDVMIRAQGARALDWMGADLADLGSVVELGRWYRREMGLKVEVERAGAWTEVAWIRDVGPIAFEEVGIAVPVTPGVPSRVRLVFPADSWRIDALGVASGLRRPAFRRVPLAASLGRDGGDIPAVRERLAAPDGSYLETRPGQYFTAVFEAGPAPAGTRTLLLATQGYYTEWLRPAWLRPSGAPSRFVPDSTSLEQALALWRVSRDSLERQFDATKIPVR